MIINLRQNYEILVPSKEQQLITQKFVFTQLKLEIDKMRPIPTGYIIGGDGILGELCINVDEAMWVVYYCERGERYNCAFFPGSINAANYFLWELIRINHGGVQAQPFLKRAMP